QAVVFDHVVKRILEEKCLSCHNADKAKGKLKLTDSLSILQGGKTGALFVSGRPPESLLLERILLPLAGKKPMPPLGEVQLTSTERSLLYHWIRSEAGFARKVNALPDTDTLKLLATQLLEQPTRSVEFDFPAVAAHKVEQ